MWLKKAFVLIALAIISFSLKVKASGFIDIHSPNGQVTLTIIHEEDFTLLYKIFFRGKTTIEYSKLGMKLKTPGVVLSNFDLTAVDSSVVDETWKPVWGETSSIRNNYKQLVLKLSDRSGSGIHLHIIFRVFDNGIGFRYSFPQQSKLNHFIIADELTEFDMTGDHKTFWIPGDYDTNEFMYNTSKLSEVDASSGAMSQEIFAKTFFDKNAVQTPLMMKSADGLYINIHEAALVNYPAMNLVIDKSSIILKAHLVPDAVGNKAYLQTPAVSPWRTIIVSDKAAEILASKMILNLNEPSRVKDVSWIKPQKMVGVWWEMHIGKSSWDYGATQSGSTLTPHGRHGATTANVKKYIDFAAKNGIDGVLVEGWNVGWEDWFGQWKEDVFDFVTPYSDFDLKALQRYAASKKVKLIMHHETSASVTNYERHMDTAYRFMKKYGYDAVKTGYVGHIIPRGEHHDGQWMVKHYERVMQKTASYKIMLDAHEPVRPTGLHRTYPNFLACEAARGNEFNAWSVGNPPEHETILPFTRLMGGPMDYTPGLFRIKLNQFDSTKKEQIHTTLCKQLALYVTMYSPLQMAADLPENYEKYMDAFQFIKDVAVDWDNTKILDAEPGDYIIEARKAKGKDNWFLGAITDEQARKFTITPDFLDKNRWYYATIYSDADNADWKNNPEAYVIKKIPVQSSQAIDLKLAPGGGCAISFVPLTEDKAIQILKGGKPKIKRKKERNS
ncbi:MAG TPA: glycoside hydrolase family 97 protein [Chitinophagaceae bacterium]|nr:glycoside hydrolase family 97 protein [Chitinophagaceae bacterium]